MDWSGGNKKGNIGFGPEGFWNGEKRAWEL